MNKMLLRAERSRDDAKPTIYPSESQQCCQTQWSQLESFVLGDVGSWDTMTLHFLRALLGVEELCHSVDELREGGERSWIGHEVLMCDLRRDDGAVDIE